MKLKKEIADYLTDLELQYLEDNKDKVLLPNLSFDESLTLEELINHEIERAESDEAARFAVRMALTSYMDEDDFREWERHVDKIRDEIYHRPIKKSYDYLAAKEELKQYFANLTQDEAAEKKADRKRKKLLHERDIEREIEIDVNGVEAAARLKAVKSMALALKYKTLAQYQSIFCNSLAIYADLIESFYKPGVKTNRVSLKQEDTRKSIEKSVYVIIEELKGIEINIACARLLEALIDSPSVYIFIESCGATEDTGNVFDEIEDRAESLVSSYRKQFKDAFLDIQFEKVLEPLPRLRALRNERLKKTFKRIMNNSTIPIETLGSVVAIYEQNKPLIERNLAKILKEQNQYYSDISTTEA